jgi:glycerol kinase
MGYVVAIDAGTTGVRALVVDERALVVDVAYRELTQYFPRPGWVEHDATEIWEAVCATLAEVGRRLAEAGRAVAAIGITNQRETLVAFDRSSGQPLHRAVVWQDRRTIEICAELEGAGHLPMVREMTGLMLDPYFTATKITWLLRHGALTLAPESADLAFGTVDSWLLWNLTGGTNGGEFATDPSNASRTMLLDTSTLAWSDDLCALFGVPRHALPEVRPSAGRFGTARLPDLGPARAVLDGLPIAGVLGDQQAALFGQCCFDPGMVKVTYGTGSFVLANAGPVRPAAPDGLTVSVAWDLGPHAGPGRQDQARSDVAPTPASAPVAYALEGSTFVSGAAIQWLRDGIGIIGDAAEAGPLAESVSDSGGVTFVPALTGLGSPWWDPAARGVITGLTRGAGRSQIVRACIEAIAFQVRDMTDAMGPASAYPLSSLRTDGGAAAMDLLLRLQAEQSRMHVARPQSTESTALGAATVAGLAEGVWGSLDELRSLWSVSSEFEPELPPELTDALYAVWRRAVDRSRGWARAETPPVSNGAAEGRPAESPSE